MLRACPQGEGVGRAEPPGLTPVDPRELVPFPRRPQEPPGASALWGPRHRAAQGPPRPPPSLTLQPRAAGRSRVGHRSPGLGSYSGLAAPGLTPNVFKEGRQQRRWVPSCSGQGHLVLGGVWGVLLKVEMDA